MYNGNFAYGDTECKYGVCVCVVMMMVMEYDGDGDEWLTEGCSEWCCELRHCIVTKLWIYSVA